MGAFEYIWLGFSSLFFASGKHASFKGVFFGGDGEGLKAYKTLATPPYPHTDPPAKLGYLQSVAKAPALARVARPVPAVCAIDLH